MEGVREYLLSVTAAAVLCGVLNRLMGEKTSFSGLLRMISGLFLCFMVISPIARLDLSDFSRLAQDIIPGGQSAVTEGQEIRQESLGQIIRDEARAYIMDKARAYGADIQVEVILSEEDPPRPQGCIISGAVSPFVRQQLQKILVTELMIPEENHQWIP